MRTLSTWLFISALGAAMNLHAQKRNLSLEQALLIANENNRTLKAGVLELKSLREDTKIARSSMLPAISAGGSYSYYFDRQVIFMPGVLTGNDSEPVVDVAVGGRNAVNSFVAFQQPLLSEPARRQTKASRIAESIQELDIKDTRAQLNVDVTATYYRALLVKESIALSRQSLQRNMKSLEDSRILLLQGRSLKVDTLRNHIVVANLQTTIASLETQHKIVLLQLAQLMGISEGDSLTLTDSLSHDRDAMEFPLTLKAHADAIQNRPDIQSQRLNVELQKNMVSRSRAERLPTVSLIGTYQIQAQADHRKFDSYRWPRTSFVGIQANVPIFSGNRINSKIRQATLRQQSEELRLEDATQKANTEIAMLRNSLQEVVQRLSVQGETVRAAEINFTIVNDRYRNGLSSRLELSDAELALTEAKMSYLHSVYNVKIAELQLNRALGTL